MGNLIQWVHTVGKTKVVLTTFVERKIHLYTTIKIHDSSSHSMQKAIEYLGSILPLKTFKIAMSNRDKEFTCNQSVKETLKIYMCFADPYCFWQREVIMQIPMD